MGYCGVNLLRLASELDGLIMLLSAATSGFLVGPLSGVLFRVFLKYFEIFRRVPGAMQQACLFCTGCPIAWMACIVFLALASADLLGVG